MLPPTPERIVAARERAGLTQAEAAKVVHLAHSIRWSEYERGVHRMPLSTWELFLIKVGQREGAAFDPAPCCLGDPGECAFNGACMYACERAERIARAKKSPLEGGPKVGE